MKALLPNFSFTPLPLSPTNSNRPLRRPLFSPKCLNTTQPSTAATQEDGIPADLVKTLVRFKSRHNYIRVLQVSRTADHPFRGSRLLLLDSPGNIHSISFQFKTLTDTYFDVFATLPPLLPPGPVGILGFGAGSAAKLLLDLYPESSVHGWEIDAAVVDVGREYFGLARLEKQFQDRLFVYIGNALNASLTNGFSGIMVDLFSKGCLLPELQDPATWLRLKSRLREGGRIMVNVGGSCVESEDSTRDGKVVMEETLMAMQQVFGKDGLNVLRLGNRKDDSSIALTGRLPADLEVWEKNLPRALKCYVHMWTPLDGCVLEGMLNLQMQCRQSGMVISTKVLKLFKIERLLVNLKSPRFYKGDKLSKDNQKDSSWFTWPSLSNSQSKSASSSACFDVRLFLTLPSAFADWTHLFDPLLP